MVTAERKRHLRALARGAFLGFLLFASLYANIFIHEFGHFAVASNLGLNPEMHFFDDGTGEGFSFTNQNFYTTYSNDSEQTDGKDALIAFAGPAANILLSVWLFSVYRKLPKTKRIKRLAILMLLIPSVLSAISNLLPMAGSDGSIIWGFLN